MNLFEDLQRTDRHPSGHSESYWHFYDRVAGPYWEQVRAVLEEWFGHLENEDVQKGIRGRMRSGDNGDFRSALAELYVHESLIRSGFSVSYEPELPGSTRRPDFLAERAGESFIVEVTTRVTSEDDPAGARREASLHDSLNSLALENFFLEFEVDQRGPNAISARPLKKALKAWLAILDPDEVAEILARGDHDAIPRIEFDHEGWRISFRAFAVRKGARGIDPDRRAIGISGGGGRWINDRQIIREALSDKTHAYGRMGRPFVVALALDSLERNEEVEAALFGEPTVELTETSDGTWVQTAGRSRDGYWVQPDSTGRSQVSGLLVLPGIAPWSLANTSPTLWVHPRADHPAPVLPSWGAMTVTDEKLHFHDPEMTPWTLFGLSPHWPIGTPFGENP